LTPSHPAILQIIPRLDAGGAERSTVDVATALVDAGFAALVVSEGGRMESELRAAGAVSIHLPVASKNPLTMLRNARRLRTIIREYGVGLVHARSRAPAWSALMAARRESIPFVTTHHGTYNARGGLKRFYNSVMLRGEAVIANSAWTAEHLKSVHSVVAKRVEIIPRGIDMEKFDPARVSPEQVAALRENWRASDQDRVVLLPGRLTRWKGQLVLIEALSYLKSENRLPPNLHAVIAGDAQGRRAYVDEIVSAIAKGSLGDRVTLAAHIGDMATAYRASDIVVSASTEPEAFGRVAAEAGAAGRPIIATDHGGARETVVDGESGILVPPGDAHALGDALARLAALPPERLSAMGARGHAHVAARFTVEKMCAATLALYGDLLKAAPKS